MPFNVTSTSNTAEIKTRGNVRIDYGHTESKNINSVYTYNGKTQISNSNNEQDDVIRMNDECYNVLMDITGKDEVLEQTDLNRIDQVFNKYKKVLLGINKKNIKDGEITLSFKNGYTMTIDFETDEEQKANDKIRGYKAPYGTKKEYYRNDLIEKYKDKYNITKEVKTNREGQKYAIYKITAQQDVNLSKLTSDLGIDINIIGKHNSGYGKYSYNGSFIGNKPMKNNTIQIPIGDLGYELDERNIIVQFLDSIF